MSDDDLLASDDLGDIDDADLEEINSADLVGSDDGDLDAILSNDADLAALDDEGAELPPPAPAPGDGDEHAESLLSSSDAGSVQLNSTHAAETNLEPNRTDELSTVSRGPSPPDAPPAVESEPEPEPDDTGSIFNDDELTCISQSADYTIAASDTTLPANHASVTPSPARAPARAISASAQAKPLASTAPSTTPAPKVTSGPVKATRTAGPSNTNGVGGGDSEYTYSEYEVEYSSASDMIRLDMAASPSPPGSPNGSLNGHRSSGAMRVVSPLALTLTPQQLQLQLQTQSHRGPQCYSPQVRAAMAVAALRPARGDGPRGTRARALQRATKRRLSEAKRQQAAQASVERQAYRRDAEAKAARLAQDEAQAQAALMASLTRRENGAGRAGRGGSGGGGGDTASAASGGSAAVAAAARVAGYRSSKRNDALRLQLERDALESADARERQALRSRQVAQWRAAKATFPVRMVELGIAPRPRGRSTRLAKDGGDGERHGHHRGSGSDVGSCSGGGFGGSYSKSGDGGGGGGGGLDEHGHSRSMFGLTSEMADSSHALPAHISMDKMGMLERKLSLRLTKEDLISRNIIREPDEGRSTKRWKNAASMVMIARSLEERHKGAGAAPAEDGDGGAGDGVGGGGGGGNGPERVSRGLSSERMLGSPRSPTAGSSDSGDNDELGPGEGLLARNAEPIGPDLAIWERLTSEPPLEYADRRRVSAGTLDRLVEHLTSERGTASDLFLRVFMLTFKAFVSPARLLSLLLGRYHQPRGMVLAMAATRARIAVVLETWVSISFEDFTAKPELLAALKAFVGTDMVRDGLVDESARLRISMDTEAGREVDRRRAEIADVRSVSISGGVRDVLQLEPSVLAAQLTVKMFGLFARIRTSELLRASWTHEATAHLSPRVLDMIAGFNAVSQWIVFEILKREKPRERAALITMFINVGSELRILKNYDTIMALVAALNSAPIARLEKSISLVKEKHRGKLAELESLISSAANYKAYRKELFALDRGIPCMPYVGMFLKDLFAIHDANQDEAPNIPGGINFTKHSQTAAVIMQVQRFQATPYAIAAAPAVLTMLSASVNVDANALYDLSLKREPRQAGAAT